MGKKKSWGDTLKERWNVLAEAAAWLLSLIGTFLVPPPTGTQQSPQDSPVWHFGRFVLILFVGLLLVPVQSWNRAEHTPRWFVLAVIGFVGCFVAFFGYTYLGDTWTCKYDGRSVVVGSEWTTHGAGYAAGPGANLTCEQRLWEHRGEVEELWTKESIDSRRRLLALIYLLSLLLFSAALICVLQTVYCRQRRSV